MVYPNDIKTHPTFKNLLKCTPRTIGKRHNHHLIELLTMWTSFLGSDVKPSQRLWHIHNDCNGIPQCLVCNSPTRWTTAKSSLGDSARYTAHCSNKCRALDPTVEKKRVETCLSRHGEDKSLSNASHAESTRASSIASTGVRYPLQNESIRTRTVKSLEARLGIDANKKIRELAAMALTRKYGEGTLGRQLSSASIRSKAAATRKAKWLPDRINELSKNGVELVSDVADHMNNKTMMLWKCSTCNHVFEHQIRDGVTPRCLACFPLNRVNCKQNELLHFVRTICETEVVDSDRKTIAPKELDIYIPSHRLAIEYNGLYWHSDLRMRDAATAHRFKTDQCEQQGIRLLHIFEDEWKSKRQIVESVIKRALGVPSITIAARKCQIREIGSKEANIFLSTNHLQGADRSSVRLGMFYENELIGLMTFGKSRFDKAIQWELVRLAFKMNMVVVGGAQRMFKHFVRSYDPSTIITYSDRRWFTGSVYENLGFAFDGVTSPAYFYVDTKEGCVERYSRQRYQKHKLKDVLAHFNGDLSEAENMRLNGFGRVYDSGNKRWKWNKEKDA